MGVPSNPTNSDLAGAPVLTWEDSLTGVCTGAQPTDVVLYRLEFGKFCTTPNGPVEKEGGIGEHRVLGKSHDFPQSLSSYCNPSYIRVVNSEGESTPITCAHATVLVPCVTATDGTRQIFCRIRQRAEDGEGGVERKYNIARYLVPSDLRATPLLLFEAMQTIPLHGLSRVQVAQLPPLRILPREFVPSRMAQEFAKEALMFAVSGIPIGFADTNSERKFFESVTALWFLLPPNLRPLLSLGWGGGSSIPGRMTVTYADSRDPTLAVFSAADHSWTRPTKLRVTGSNGAAEVVGYYPERRRLGEDFWQLFYGGDDDASRFITFEDAARERALDWVTELPVNEFAGIVDWNSSNSIRAFRTPGLKAHDLRMLMRLHSWLRGANVEGAVALNASEFTYQKTRIAAFELILDAVADPQQRTRGELALWETLTPETSPTFAALLAENDRRGSSRALLIDAIRRNDEVQTLKYLLHAAGTGQASDLSASANECLQTILNSSVKSGGVEILSHHSNLLTLAEVPEIYRSWAIRHRLDLVHMSAQDSNAIDPQISQRLFELSMDNAILSMLTLDRSLPPGKRDELTLENLSASDREKFIWLLETRWLQIGGDVAARRENLDPWLKLLRPTTSGNALWSLALNEPVTLNAQCAEIAEEVKYGRLPVSLREPVAILALELWPRFSAFVNADRHAWTDITHLFPPDFEKVLLCSPLNVSSRAVSREIREAAQKCRPEPDEVNRLISYWAEVGDLSRFGPLLWRWAISDRANSGAAGLISRVSQLKHPGITTTWNDIDRVVKLARAADQEHFFLENQEELWKPTLVGWQAMLMLRLMPRAEITPTIEQLNSLLPYREQLRRHFEERVGAGRRQSFRLASLGFLELDYEKNRKFWREAYTETNLWSVFRRVPLRKQQPHSLIAALRSFTEGAADRDVIEKRARMCLDYLNSYLSTDDYERALRKVMVEGLRPLLFKRFGQREVILQLMKDTEKDISARSGGGGFFMSLFAGRRDYRRVHITPPSLEELLFNVVEGCMSYSSLSGELRNF